MHKISDIIERDTNTLKKILYSNFNAKLNKRNFCVYRSRDCNKIANSHSVPQQAILQIANSEKKVLVIDRSRHAENERELYVKPMPTVDFSTTKSFCRHHDKLVYSTIEDLPVEINYKNNNLLILRALVYQLHQYKTQPSIIKQMEKYKDRNSRNLDYRNERLGAKKMVRFIEAEINCIKSEIDCNNYSRYSGVLHRLDKIPEVMCSEVFRLAYTNTKNPQLSFLVVNIAADKNGGYIHFGYKYEDKRSIDYLQRILIENDYSKLIIHLFGLNENFCFSEEWYNTLRIPCKSVLAYVNYLYSTTGPNSSDKIIDIAVANHKKIVDWKNLTTAVCHEEGI